MGCNRLGTAEDKEVVQKELAVAEAKCHAPDCSGAEVQAAFERGGMPAVLALQASKEANRLNALFNQQADHALRERFSTENTRLPNEQAAKEAERLSSNPIFNHQADQALRDHFAREDYMKESGQPTSESSLPNPSLVASKQLQQTSPDQADNMLGEQSATSQEARELAERQSRLSSGQYETTFNTSGQVQSIEGWLKKQPGEAPSTPIEEGKDRGHLIGKQFGGSGDASNVIPMDPRINRSYINAFEGAVAREVASGREVYMKVSVEYGGDGMASKISYHLFERQGSNVVNAGSMEIDPNKTLDYTLKQGLGGGIVVDEAFMRLGRRGMSVREFSNPFHRPSGAFHSPDHDFDA